MKQLTLLLSFALLPIIGSAQTTTEKTDGPVLEIVSNQINLGLVYRGQISEKGVNIKNTGNDTLIINALVPVDMANNPVQSGIGYRMDKYKIGPGETGRLIASTRGGYSTISEYVRIESNNKTGYLFVHVRGRVARDPEERRRRTTRDNYDRLIPSHKEEAQKPNIIIQPIE